MVSLLRGSLVIRRFFLWCFLSALALLLSACGEKQESNRDWGNKNRVLFVANGEEPKGLDPHLTAGDPDRNVIVGLFEGLTKLHPKTLEPGPGVAESWTISDDGLTYIFNIRENARWSNGDPLTAHDFVWSYKRALTPTLPNEYAYMMFYFKNGEAFYTGEIDDFSEVGVKALNDYQLQLELANPTSFFLQVLDHHSFYPVHKATVLAGGDLDDPSNRWTIPETFVGNGPFTLKRWEINNVIELEKNPHFWGAEDVWLEGIHFYPITEYSVEERYFRSGKIHLTHTPQMAIEKIAVYREKNPEFLRIYPNYATYYYSINMTQKPFDDVRVRKALALSIDRKTLVEKVTKGEEVPAYTMVPPDPEGYQPKSYFSYDPELARQLLAEAGYPNGEGFPVRSVLYNTNENHKKVALAIQQMWKDTLNIDIQLENQEWKVYLNTMLNLHHDIGRTGWIADYVEPTNFFNVLIPGGGNNYTGWASPEYKALLDEINATVDIEKRYELFEKANKMIADVMPLIPLYYYSDLNLVHTSVKGWYSNVMHYHRFEGVYLEDDSE